MIRSDWPWRSSHSSGSIYYNSKIGITSSSGDGERTKVGFSATDVEGFGLSRLTSSTGLALMVSRRSHAISKNESYCGFGGGAGLACLAGAGAF